MLDLLATPMDWDISSSSSPRYLFLDFQCPVLRPCCPRSLLRTSLLFCGACADCPRSPNLEDFHSGSAIVQAIAVDIANWPTNHDA
ncbi:hypothetical protein Tco_0078621 [Tanacetum coccineum]